MGKAKRKSRAIVTDGTGSVTTRDRRFEKAEWPIELEIASSDAEVWLQYLWTECATRGWACSQMTQMERRENSGSITLGVSSANNVVLVWERKKDKPIKIKARVEGTGEFSVNDANQLLNDVAASSARRTTQSIYCRGQLQYVGLPWRGELWLDDLTCLGPPSQQYEEATIGPRNIIVHTRVDAIDATTANGIFAVKLREIAIFLSTVARVHARFDQRAQQWTQIPASGSITNEVRFTGYVELALLKMPTRGATVEIPCRQVQRPDFARYGGINVNATELHLPDDIVELWQRYSALSTELRDRFLRAGNLWHCAQTIEPYHPTTRFALTVASCEALKPEAAEYNSRTIYHVVGGLFGKPLADELTRDDFAAHVTRSLHFHTGALRGKEFTPQHMISSFVDRSFEEAWHSLYLIVAASFVQWLSVGGEFEPLPLKRPPWWRLWWRRGRLVIALGAAIAAGWIARGL